MNDTIETTAEPADTSNHIAGSTIGLQDFIAEFGSALLQQVRSQNPPVYSGVQQPARNLVLDCLKRKPFEAQRDAVHALAQLLLDHDAPAAVLNAEMGTGKTMMAICVAASLR
jgi:hypothetical protein